MSSPHGISPRVYSLKERPMAPQLFFTPPWYIDLPHFGDLSLAKQLFPITGGVHTSPLIYVVASNMHKTKQRAPLDQRVLHNNIFTRVIFHASNLILRMCCLATLSVALIFCRESFSPCNNPAIYTVIRLILLY